MPDSLTARPSMCLNMIVRNEAHIVADVLDVVAPYISYWVIVDTGSEDETQHLIRNHMTGLGIPGELHERPWRNFGHNRSEALALARGHADYIWIMDADDTIVGTPDFTQLDADVYALRYFGDDEVFWRALLVRDAAPVRWVGVVHEVVMWDDPGVVMRRLDGDYHIEDRHLGARSLPADKYARDRDLLLAELERDPDDSRSVFYLAQSYFNLGDWANARRWYARRSEMGGGEEVGYSMYKLALSMENLGARWPDVQDAYLRAWEFRPARAEGLYAIARRYRSERRYRLGYLFAKEAADVPFPEQESLFVPDIYTWRIADEQAVCASWIDKHAEAFILWRRILTRPELPAEDRQRIAANRDVCAPTMIDAASHYPDFTLLQSLQHPAARDPEVVVSLIAGPDRASTELTLNSFLRCCTDASRVGRFLAVDAGLSAHDRALLCQRYGFLDFAQPDTQLGQICERFWLHLDQGWQFFAPEDLITRLSAVLEAEQDVFQVGINFTDAVGLTGACADEDAVRRTPDAGRYVVTDAPAHGPAMFDTTRIDRAGGWHGSDADPVAELGRRAAATGLRTASLDEVLCIRMR